MQTLKLFLLLSSAIILTSPLFGQGVSTGDLHVTVTDPQVQPIADASVSVTDREKGTQRQASANGSGEYEIFALPPSSYVLTVKAMGFAPVSEDVVIEVGASAHVPVTLKVGTATEAVQVRSDAAEVI